jgi:hypothetical protein
LAQHVACFPQQRILVDPRRAAIFEHNATGNHDGIDRTIRPRPVSSCEMNV